MKKHSKLIALMLAAVLLGIGFTVAVSAMATEDEATLDEIPQENAMDDISVIPEPDTEIPDAQNPQTETPDYAEGGIIADEDFSVTVNSHIFKTERVLLVTVENISDKAYSIDVTVSYLNPDGKVIETELQSFDQLAEGFAWNMVFRPEYDFADYCLEVTKTEFNGDCWITDVEMTYYGMNRGFGDYDVKAHPHQKELKVIGEAPDKKCSANFRYPTYHCQNDTGTDIVATSVVLVIFDNNGNIFDIRERGGQVYLGPDSYYNYKSFMGYAFINGDEVGDAELANISNSTAFVAYTAVLAKDIPW